MMASAASSSAAAAARGFGFRFRLPATTAAVVVISLLLVIAGFRLRGGAKQGHSELAPASRHIIAGRNNEDVSW